MSDNEISLVDDEVEIVEHLGSLSFSEDGRCLNSDGDTRMKETFSSSELKSCPKAMSQSLHFEVTDAKIITEYKTKFVVYTVLMKTNSSDLAPVSLDRRYSHFAELNSQLRKEFPSVMSEVIFPRKQLLGNFKPQTIAERSRKFEQFLCHLVHIPEVRLSKPFKTFFTSEVLSNTNKLFHARDYNKCVPLLRRVLQLQKKLYGDFDMQTVKTLCALTVCFLETGCKSEAQLCSEFAASCLRNSHDDQLLVPLLQLSIRLCWELGRNKQELEQHLETLSAGKQTMTADTFTELVTESWKQDT